MSDANVATILEQSTVLSPRGAVDVSFLLENNGSLASQLLDAFHKYTSAGPEADEDTDRSPASDTSTLPDVVAAAPPTEVRSDDAAAEGHSEGTASPELIVTIPSETEEPLVEAELGGFTTTEVWTEVVREGMQQLMVEAAELVDGYLTLAVTVPSVPWAAVAERVVGEMTTEDTVGEMTTESEIAVEEMETEVETPNSSVIVEKVASNTEADMTADVEYPISSGEEETSSAVLTLEDNVSKLVTSQYDILVVSEKNVESPPEVNLLIPSELVETVVVSMEEKLHVSKTTDTVVIEMDAVSRVIPDAMTPVTPANVELTAPEIEAPVASVLMESVTPNVVAPVAFEVVFTPKEIEIPVASDLMESVTPDVVAPVALKVVFTPQEIETPVASDLTESNTPDVVAPVALEVVFTPQEIETPVASVLMESVTPNVVAPVALEVAFTAKEIEKPVASVLMESVTPDVVAPVALEVVFIPKEIETPVASVLMESVTPDVVVPVAFEVVTPVASDIMVSVTPDVVAQVAFEVVTPVASDIMESVTPDVVEPLVSTVMFIAPEMETPVPSDLVSELAFTSPEMETPVVLELMKSVTTDIMEPVVSEVVFTVPEIETPDASDTEIETGMPTFNAAVTSQMNEDIKPQGITDATPEQYVSLPEATIHISTEPLQKAKKTSNKTRN